MIYDLPTSVEIQGVEYAIRSDYRAILDICIALNDPEMDDRERAIVSLSIFYPDFETMPQEHIDDAIAECFRFINGGETDDKPAKKQPRLVDWEQDFPLIVSPVNRVMGREIRAMEYLHWYSFLAAYQEIGGDCTFSQVVTIRDKQSRNKPLDKGEKEWYRRNQKLVDIKRKYTEADEKLFKEWF